MRPYNDTMLGRVYLLTGHSESFHFLRFKRMLDLIACLLAKQIIHSTIFQSSVVKETAVIVSKRKTLMHKVLIELSM